MTKKTRANLKLNPNTSTTFNDGQTLPAEQFLHIADSMATLDDDFTPLKTRVDTSIDTDGTLLAGAVDVVGVIANAIITGAKIASNTVANSNLATDAKVGSLATLTTTEKASVVGALNELDAQVMPLDMAFDINTGTQRVGLWKSAGSYALDIQGALNATALTVNGLPVGSSSDTYFDAVTGGITYGSKVGIGTGVSEPAATFEVVGPPAAATKVTSSGSLTTAIDLPNNFVGEFTTTVNGGSVRHVYASTTISGTHDVATNSGFYAQTFHANTAGRLTHGWGLVGRMYKTGSGSTVQQMAGVYSNFNVSGSGEIDAAYGYYQNPADVSAGTIVAAYGLDTNQPSVSGSGVVEDNYGIRVGATTVGTQSNFGVYIEESSGYGIYNRGGDVYSVGDMDLTGDMDLNGDLSLLDGNFTVIASDTLGGELLTNGAFTSDTTGWTAAGSATLASVSGGESGNALEVTNAGGTGYAVQQITTAVGQRYRLTFYYKNGTATQGAVFVGTTSGGSQLSTNLLSTAANWTARTVDFTATTTTTHIRVGISGSTVGHTMLYDTVSVKALLGGTIEANNLITAKGGFRTASVVIADDTVLDLRAAYPNIATAGQLLISTANYGNSAGIITFRAASSPFCTVVAQPATDIIVGTAALAGTTGTDGKLNIAATSSGNLHVENRRGASATFIITILD